MIANPVTFGARALDDRPGSWLLKILPDDKECRAHALFAQHVQNKGRHFRFWSVVEGESNAPHSLPLLQNEEVGRHQVKSQAWLKHGLVPFPAAIGVLSVGN
jgi:hypothetical protein